MQLREKKQYLYPLTPVSRRSSVLLPELRKDERPHQRLYVWEKKQEGVIRDYGLQRKASSTSSSSLFFLLLRWMPLIGADDQSHRLAASSTQAHKQRQTVISHSNLMPIRDDNGDVLLFSAQLLAQDKPICLEECRRNPAPLVPVGYSTMARKNSNFCISALFFTPFKRYVEIGRVALINYGKDYGKLVVIVDVIDQNRALVDAPDMVRSQMNFKRLSLTDIKIDIPRVPNKKTLITAMEAADVKNKWDKSSWGRKLIVQKRRASLNDFNRFKVMLANIKRGGAIRQELAKLKKQAAAA
ncbi:hypothetical protein ACLOJK_011426 [Asimina triloba]